MFWLVLLTVVVGAAYVFLVQHYSKWQRLGIAFDRPHWLYGSIKQVVYKKLPVALVLHQIYSNIQKPIVGIYLLFKPALLIRDVHLVKAILINDFESFHDRGVFVDERNDPLTASLFVLKGKRWRNLRIKLTPSFSTGKLKAMFETFDDVGNKLVDYLIQQLDQEEKRLFNIKNVMATYAIDIIGSVIFGLDVNGFVEKHPVFHNLTALLFDQSNFLIKIRSITNFICPPISKIIATLSPDNDTFSCALREIIRSTIEQRQEKGIVRKDLMQLLIQLRNTGSIEEDSNEFTAAPTTADNAKHMTIDQIAAQAFLFYVAGSETTSATIAFTLYEMAMNQSILKKAQHDVDTILLKHNLKANGTYTYDAIQDMKYLDLCVKETIRKYPAAPFLNRECTREYPIPDLNFTIAKGTAIIISLLSIHRDEQYFPEPLVYQPERFCQEKSNYNPMAYMPFGDGPRHCVAQRMGVLNTKVALAKILANFNIENMPYKEIEFGFHSSPVLQTKHPLEITLSKRYSSNNIATKTQNLQQ